ncbi:MAG TPA: response regulator [Xanthomonadales bacterium]|nr:response regulator [Xanthomonadales bacterium]
MTTKQLSGKPKRILVADDDVAIVESTCMVLRENGYQVDSADDKEAINKMEKSLPDLLLLDIWMSGQDGREICKYLKSKELTRHIPIILISASHDIAKSAKGAGSDDFLAKPYGMYELLEKVAKYLDPVD